MNLTREDVLKLADIAKLELSEAQADALLGDLEKMLGFVDKVRALDLDGVEPLVSSNRTKPSLVPAQINPCLS